MIILPHPYSPIREGSPLRLLRALLRDTRLATVEKDHKNTWKIKKKKKELKNFSITAHFKCMQCHYYNF